MNWADFSLGFWHPFGPYCGRSVEEILKWKQDEVERHQWTFWSFAYAPSAEKWYPELRRQTDPVYVLCSHSAAAIDPNPNAKLTRATRYRFLGTEDWQAMPTEDGGMFVTNPFKRGRATAFKVTGVQIFEPYRDPDFTVEWFARDKGDWSSHKLPTRGEFLIRRGGQAELRKVRAVLEISPPYLAVLDCEILKG